MNPRHRLVILDQQGSPLPKTTSLPADLLAARDYARQLQAHLGQIEPRIAEPVRIPLFNFLVDLTNHLDQYVQEPKSVYDFMRLQGLDLLLGHDFSGGSGEWETRDEDLRALSSDYPDFTFLYEGDDCLLVLRAGEVL